MQRTSICKQIWLCTLAAVLAGTARAETATTSPPVEAVITYQLSEPSAGGAATQTWYKHGDDIRVDWHPDDDSGDVGQSFFRTGKPVLKLIRVADGRWRYAAIATDSGGPPPLAARTFTGATETHLGESCRAWATYDATSRTALETGCITDSGIELRWTRALGDILVAASIAYQPVARETVQPPLRALDLRNWAAKHSGDHGKDYRVCLRTTAARDAGYCITRSGSWVMRTGNSTLGSTFHLSNDAAAITVDGTMQNTGPRSLVIRRNLQPSRPPELLPVEGRAPDMIAGNSCRWMYTRPSDASMTQFCRTPDGIILGIDAGPFQTVKNRQRAVLFERAPQSLESVMPDARMMQPGFWGY